MDSFEEIKERAIDQSNRPAQITRKEAEKVCRSIIASQRGSADIPPNLFKDSVDQLMEEINGAEFDDA